MEEILNEIRLINTRLNRIEGYGSRTNTQVRAEVPSSERTQFSRVQTQQRENWENNGRVFYGRREGRTPAQGSLHENGIFRGAQRQERMEIHRRHPTGPREMEVALSTNTEFPELSKRLYQGIQLRHHNENWRNLPHSLETKLDDVFNNVVPPMPNEKLKEKLKEINNTAKSTLVIAIQEHLHEMKRETEAELKELNKGDYDRAEELARARARRQFRGKFNLEKTNGWLSEMRASTGEKLLDTTGNGTRAGRRNESEAQNWCTENRGTKRPLNSSPPIQITNRFYSLRNTDETEFPTLQSPAKKTNKNPSPKVDRSIRERKTGEAKERITKRIGTCQGEVEQSDDEMGETVGKITVRECTTDVPGSEDQDSGETLVKQLFDLEGGPYNQKDKAPRSAGDIGPEMNPTDQDDEPDNQPQLDQIGSTPHTPAIVPLGDRTQQYPPIVHDKEAKTTWAITRVRPGSQTLVIADSQFRYIRNLPRDWEVHVFPGATLNHGARILENLGKNPRQNIKRIIVHIGINNKTWGWSNILVDLNKITLQLSRTGTQVAMMGVSIPNHLPSGEKRELQRMNSHTYQRIGSENFIQPIPMEQVGVSPTGSNSIHYDQETLDSISVKIKNHFLEVSRLPRRVSM